MPLSPSGTVYNGTNLDRLVLVDKPRLSVNGWGSDVLSERRVCWTELMPQLRPALYSAHPDYPNLYCQPYEIEIDGPHAVFDLVYKGSLSRAANAALPPAPAPEIRTFEATASLARFLSPPVSVPFIGTERVFRYLSKTPLLASSFEGAEGIEPVLVSLGSLEDDDVRLSTTLSRTLTVYGVIVVEDLASSGSTPVHGRNGAALWYEVTRTQRTSIKSSAVYDQT